MRPEVGEEGQGGRRREEGGEQEGLQGIGKRMVRDDQGDYGQTVVVWLLLSSARVRLVGVILAACHPHVELSWENGTTFQLLACTSCFPVTISYFPFRIFQFKSFNSDCPNYSSCIPLPYSHFPVATSQFPLSNA